MTDLSCFDRIIYEKVCVTAFVCHSDVLLNFFFVCHNYYSFKMVVVRLVTHTIGVSLLLNSKEFTGSFHCSLPTFYDVVI